MLEISSQIEDAQIELDKANAICSEVLERYFVAAEPDVLMLKMAYKRNQTLLCIVLECLDNMAPKLTDAVNALYARQKEEKEA